MTFNGALSQEARIAQLEQTVAALSTLVEIMSRIMFSSILADVIEEDLAEEDSMPPLEPMSP